MHAGTLVPHLSARQVRLDPGAPVALVHGQDDTIARCRVRNSCRRMLPTISCRGATGDWEVVIGLEVHAQVASKAKLFSGASTEFGGAPNSHVSLVDAAMPGMLPVINEECVAQAVRTGLGLKAQVNLVSVFDRKNYFYPDLPQGYQNLAVQAADRRRGPGGDRCRRHRAEDRHRAPAPGAGRRQVDPRPASRN